MLHRCPCIITVRYKTGKTRTQGQNTAKCSYLGTPANPIAVWKGSVESAEKVQGLSHSVDPTLISFLQGHMGHKDMDQPNSAPGEWRAPEATGQDGTVWEMLGRVCTGPKRRFIQINL